MAEYLWYILASALAGVGTGLVGLSAATVMVPILIVLCPSFAGETGAYQATAIALASDILGSAVTTATYIRHKNIDLRRGWIMLACIIGMCTVGSFAAWRAGNVVLGGFTLILTFCIGIRFLVKPSTERADAGAKGAALDWNGGGRLSVLRSDHRLWHGLCGLRWRHDDAGGVHRLPGHGAEVRRRHQHLHHDLHRPHRLGEPHPHPPRYPAGALAGADFVHDGGHGGVFGLRSVRQPGGQPYRGAGDGGGAHPAGRGAHPAALLGRHRRPAVGAVHLEMFGEYLLFIIPAALVLLLLHFTTHIPKVVFRKLLHLPAFCSAVVIVWRADSWQAASLTLALFAAIVYPALCLCERWQGYGGLFVQKAPGEIKKSLLLLFLSDAALVALCWGAFNLPWVASAAILMWGSGDGAAALAGHRFGRRHVRLPLADPKKTWEGSAAMVLVSAAVGTAAMLVLTAMPWWQCLLFALAAAIPGAYTELISRNGDDTVTVPVVNTAVLLALCVIFL